MSDLLTPRERKQLSTMVEKEGVAATANRLGVHRTSVNALLAHQPVRPNTVKVIRAALQDS